ncbi:MAG: hypothetical protein LC115_09330 [Bacteroidia bacterium]|nr:hypothetical protein [Bacteroidia bacterium]
MAIRPEGLLEKILQYLELKLQLVLAKTQLTLRHILAVALVWLLIVVISLISIVIISIALGAWIGYLIGAWYWGILIIGGLYALLAVLLYVSRRPLFKKISLHVDNLLQKATQPNDPTI